MNFVRNFFSIEYYSGILTGHSHFKPILAAIVLALILSVKPSLFVVKTVLPLAQNLEKHILDLIDEIYPQELEIKITNGRASTNITEPYYITVRQETLENLFSLKPDNQNTKTKARLLTIDTKGRADEFERYQSLALLTETSIVYYRDDNVNIYPLREINNLTVNKDAILSQVKEINKDNKVGKLIIAGVLLAPFLILLWSIVARLAIFFFLSLIVYLMVKINQLPIGFKKIFSFTSAISFIPILLWEMLSFMPFFAGNITSANYILPIIIWGLSYGGLNYFQSHQASSNDKQPIL